MSKRSLEINLYSGIRLSEWLEEVNITQKELANRIYYTQQQISKIVKGKAALLPHLAETISAAAPKLVYNNNGDIIKREYVRPQYLLGLDEFKTDADRIRATLHEAEEESSSMFTGLSMLAKVNGIMISPPAIDGVNDADAAVAAIKAGYSIEKDGASISMSLEEMNAFENHIADMVKAQLELLFTIKGGAQNG